MGRLHVAIDRAIGLLERRMGSGKVCAADLEALTKLLKLQAEQGGVGFKQQAEKVCENCPQKAIVFRLVGGREDTPVTQQVEKAGEQVVSQSPEPAVPVQEPQPEAVPTPPPTPPKASPVSKAKVVYEPSIIMEGGQRRRKNLLGQFLEEIGG